MMRPRPLPWPRRSASGAALLVLAAALLAAGCRPAPPSRRAAASPPARAVTVTPIAAPELLVPGQPVQGGLIFGRASPGALLLLDGKPVPVAEDGRLMLGFDRDQGETALLEARFPGGPSVTRRLAVAPRAWRIERIDLARRPGPPDADYQRLRERELARIAAARALDPPAQGWRQAFIWPARGRVSGVFGSQRIYRGEPASFHNGVDVAARAGAAVVAPADGVVVLAGPPALSLEGNLVILAHGLGLSSAFLHLSAVHVREGQLVRQGEPIGAVGSTGRATGPHLHWGLRWRAARVDPQSLVGAMP